MASISYDEIYSRFFTKAQAYDFLDLTEMQLNEFLCNWLHAAVANPYVRRLFSEVKLDDEIQTMNYVMKYQVDADSDKEYIIEVLSLGVLINWISPKVKSMITVSQTYGTSELKFYSEANQLAQLQELEKNCIRQQRRVIADRGYIWNTYLNGET